MFVDEARPSLHCANCGYNVRGLPTATCPECGSDLHRVGVRSPRPSRARQVLYWLTVLACLVLPLVVCSFAYNWFFPYLLEYDGDTAFSYEPDPFSPAARKSPKLYLAFGGSAIVVPYVGDEWRNGIRTDWLVISSEQLQRTRRGDPPPPSGPTSDDILIRSKGQAVMIDGQVLSREEFFAFLTDYFAQHEKLRNVPPSDVDAMSGHIWSLITGEQRLTLGGRASLPNSAWIMRFGGIGGGGHRLLQPYGEVTVLPLGAAVIILLLRWLPPRILRPAATAHGG